MKYTLLNTDTEKNLFARILKVRNIQDSLEDFLQPSYWKYRSEPKQLSDISKACKRICEAIEKKEKIMIFGDYDVDGIVSSFVLHTFIAEVLKYKNIGIQLPHREKDWYGIKSYHLDEIKQLGCTLVITVDNWITATEEAKNTKEIGIDLIITDHHHALAVLPEPFALVNPQTSSKVVFKEVCWATVIRKVCLEIATYLKLEKEKKKAFYEATLPYIWIATIADCMPLIKENRLLVKKALHLMNQKRSQLLPSLRGFLDYLQIEKVDTYHIWFMIWPRLNATGRIDSAEKWLQVLQCHNPKEQKKLLEKIEEINNTRKERQQEIVNKAWAEISEDDMVLCAADETFSAWIAWIVAGRLTEKFYKPSVVLEINHEKGIATWSLRGPSYFSVINMLKDADKLLERYGWHEQAWWLTVKVENLEALFKKFKEYGKQVIGNKAPEKIQAVDTQLLDHELHDWLVEEIQELGPFWEGNKQPVFLLKSVLIKKAWVIWKKERKHLKFNAIKWWYTFSWMRRWKWEDIAEIPLDKELSLIGEVKADSRNWGWYLDIKWIA